jgi:hypothetical protein
LKELSAPLEPIEKTVQGNRVNEDGHDLLDPLGKRIQFRDFQTRVGKIRSAEPFTYTARDIEDGEAVICGMLCVLAQVDLRQTMGTKLLKK